VAFRNVAREHTNIIYQHRVMILRILYLHLLVYLYTYIGYYIYMLSTCLWSTLNIYMYVSILYWFFPHAVSRYLRVLIIANCFFHACIALHR
jgi:uncharacterized oligopeptide transporter (OPT) family protein